MGVTLGNSGMACCSIYLVLNLISSWNTQRLLLVICCVAATASNHPREHSHSMSTEFGTFSQKTLSIPQPWFWFPCNLVERCISLFFPTWPASTEISIVFCYKLMYVTHLWHLNCTLLFLKSAFISKILLILTNFFFLSFLLCAIVS